ncbi:nuclear transport factor 2 family protein [uncultured Psychroserpens sp.]|uniref:nuclear transport factor 2 family protein n=1 Tax=uncultured Psychroserpens sp. TaxID=255436 RepID=UPI00262EB956|nr:nuclear transport factor 2 family protein [uncultured Psychroserpens sp.]
MTAKEIVKSFYDLDLAKSENAIDLIHKDCKLLWNSSNGFTSLDYDGIKNMIDGLRKAFISFNYRVSHLLEDQNTITARYTIYVTSIERPEKEDALAHFISIWEVKDGKLFKGYEISQLADDSSDSLNSYAEIKV